MSTDGYNILLLGYARSPFSDFESYLKIVNSLDEHDIQLILKQYISSFVTYKIDPGIYSIEDISKVVYTMGDSEGTLKIEYNDISMKTKLIVTHFGSIFGTLGFDEKPFFNTLLGFAPFCDYKPTIAIHAESTGVYTSEKNLNLNTIKKIHLKCDRFDGSIQNGLRQPILLSFVLDKLSGYKIFCEPETIHYKNINKSVLNTITFHLEDDNHEEINFDQEALTVTLQMIKI